MNNKPTNGVFKNIVREVVREELAPVESRLEKKFEGLLLQTERRVLQTLDEKIDNTFIKYKDEVLTGLDKVMGGLQTIREENAAHQMQHNRIDERLESIENKTS